ncbi:MAG TPA: diaminopimelate decarboxylase, partial [Rhodoblastus sp.]|nr:diaminopimelate decarboxylase [Rhodoblastus sp.]
VQSCTYNSRLLIPEVLVNDADAAVVRPRPSFDDLIGLDTIPAWLA